MNSSDFIKVEENVSGDESTIYRVALNSSKKMEQPRKGIIYNEFSNNYLVPSLWKNPAVLKNSMPQVKTIGIRGKLE